MPPDPAIDTMRAQGTPKEQRRTVVLRSGERIDCKRVLEQGEHRGMILLDGGASAVQKSNVSKIVQPAERCTNGQST